MNRKHRGRREMKKRTVGIAAWMAAGLLLLGAEPAAAEFKLGIVDVQRALLTSDEGKKAKESFQSLLEAKRKTLDERKAGVDKLRKEIEGQARILKEDARKQKEERLEKEIREFERLVKDTQDELRKKEIELQNKIVREILAAVSQIGEEEKFDLVLELNEARILYAPTKTDITAKVIDRINGKKASSGPAPAPKSPEGK